VTDVTIPILPPEEAHRMGYPVIAALEARAEAAGAAVREGGLPSSYGIRCGIAAAYRDALELVRAAHRAYGGD
jgi:hypothetical protein